MKSFQNGEWFKIAGRGNVFATQVPEDMFSRDIYRQNIQINGKQYFCTGIETFAKFREEDPVKGCLFKEGESIGLLIRGEV